MYNSIHCSSDWRQNLSNCITVLNVMFPQKRKKNLSNKMLDCFDNESWYSPSNCLTIFLELSKMFWGHPDLTRLFYLEVLTWGLSNDSNTVSFLIRRVNIFIHIWLSKEAFNNYVDRILPFFDPPPCVDSFYTLSIELVISNFTLSKPGLWTSNAVKIFFIYFNHQIKSFRLDIKLSNFSLVVA